MGIVLLKSNRHPMQMVVDSRQSILYERGLDNFEQIKVDFLVREASPGDIFIDIGACEGFYTVLLSKKVITTSLGRIYAIEPEINNLHTLMTNCKINECKNVTLNHTAISNYTGHGILHLGARSGLHSLVSGLKDRDRGETNVKVSTLDDFVRVGVQLDGPNGIKIDVEGHEMEVLEGAKNTLANQNLTYLAIDVHPSLGVSIPDVRALVQSYGFITTVVEGQGNEILATRHAT